MKIKYLKLSILKPWMLSDINRLLFQLSKIARDKSKDDLKRIIGQSQMALMAAFDGEDALVGIAAIYFYETLIKKTGIIEDVVVDEKYRGKGIGDVLMRALIEKAKEEKAEFIELTSNSKRAAAIAMYKKHGFQKRGTNCFRLVL